MTVDGGAGLQTDDCTFIAGRSAPGVVDGHGGIAAVRPEAIEVNAGEMSPGINRLEGVLAGASHLGDVIQFVVKTGDREVLSRRPRHSAPRLQPGQRVWCQWDESLVHLFPDTQTHLVLANPAEETAPA
jgi:spermidine/putrescine transport system ATP-binding protein